MKAYYRLFLNGFIILLVLIVTDKALGALIEHYFFTEKQGDSAITTHGVLHAREDILIFGSSRASHHYIPALISGKSGLSCYNLGRDGMKMLYYEELLVAVLSYHNPKIVILDLNLSDFEDTPQEEELLTTVFMPYIQKNKAVSDLIYRLSKTEFALANISTLYRLNSLPLSILQHNLEIGQKQFNGYEPLFGTLPKTSKVIFVDKKNYKESKAQLKAFENIVQLTQSKHIKLCVLVSPGMKIHKNNAVKTANRILNKYRLSVYNYSGLFSPDPAPLFYDIGHLNEVGARAFTNIVIQRVFPKEI